MNTSAEMDALAEAGPVVDPLPGTVLNGAYRLGDKLGEGGMGAVYHATQLAIGRPVAVKVLHPDGVMSPAARAQMVKRFKREAVATSRLAQPHTVRVIDFGEHEGLLYLVLELLPGRTLRNLLDAEGALPGHRVAYLALQMCKSLSEAHGLGIIHRDLKPDNIFVCDFAGDTDFVKIVDFGVARMVAAGPDRTELTGAGRTLGTPAYMSPEQALAHAIGPPSDLYSLGIILYEMLAGSPPFTGTTGMEVCFKHVSHDPPQLVAPRAGQAEYPGWASLLERLLAKDPALRPQTTEEVSFALRQIRALADRAEGEGEASSPALTRGRAAADDSENRPFDTRPAHGVTGLSQAVAAPAPASPQPGRRWAWALGAVALAGAAVVVTSTLVGVEPVAPAAKEDPSPTSHPVAPPAPLAAQPPRQDEPPALPVRPAPDETAPAPPAPTPSARRTVAIASDPTGASVVRGDQQIGETPMGLTLEPGAESVEVELRKDGYEPLRVVVDATTKAVSKTLQPTPEPKPPAAVPAAAKGSKPAARPAGKPGPTKPSKPKSDDWLD